MTARRRVVVTGIGAVTPLGTTFVDTWRNLLLGHSGVVSLSQALIQNPCCSAEEMELAAQLSCQVAAPVQMTPVASGDTNQISSQSTRTSRFAQFALEAASEALAQSNGLLDLFAAVPPNEEEERDGSSNCGSRNGTDSSTIHTRTGVSIGSGVSGVREILDAIQTTQYHSETGVGTLRKLSPHFVPMVLTNSAASRVAINWHLQGPNLACSTACAAGSHAIGDAVQCIRTNMADVMLAGGTESCLNPLSLAGFARLRAMSTNFNNTPTHASRPFDALRDGFVMAEGACILVLEELEHARRRLPKNHCVVEITGYGATGDAYHITAPDPTGKGAVRAMRMAMQQDRNTCIDHQEEDYSERTRNVQYVNAHATSTPKGDEIEARAIHTVIQSTWCDSDNAIDTLNTTPIAVSSTKGNTGHMLGAAGAMEAAFTIQSLLDQRVPGTLNLEQIDVGAQLPGLFHVQGNGHTFSDNDYNLAMSNSFGFGGTNAALLFRRIKL